eukprot:maker-scaffold_4-snap-gene-21.2-mRNA-1 protein AED:0.02 eAED:0.02 QI:36/1/1/1/1/1/3/6/426
MSVDPILSSSSSVESSATDDPRNHYHHASPVGRLLSEENGNSTSSYRNKYRDQKHKHPPRPSSVPIRKKRSFTAIKENLIKRQNTLLILQFNEDGGHMFRELRRDDILKEARKGIPSIPELTASEALNGTLKARDIRLLDSSFSNSHDPEIVVRKFAVLVNLPPIKSLVLNDKCFVLVPQGADSILGPLMDRLRQKPPDERQGVDTFNFRAMEAIFITVVQILDAELQKLQPEIKQTLKKLYSSKTFSLERLRQVKGEHSRLVSRIRGVQHAFSELLENDRDMALMNLSKVCASPLVYADPEEENWEGDHEEIELLIENYVQAVDGSYNQAVLLGEEIESAMSLLMLRLDTARNHLLRVDLMVSTVTSVTGCGALVAGLLGMNLDSGADGWKYGMWKVASTVLISSFLIIWATFSYMKYKGWLING